MVNLLDFPFYSKPATMPNCLALFTKLILSVIFVYSKQLGKLVAYAYAKMQPVNGDGKLPFHWILCITFSFLIIVE